MDLIQRSQTGTAVEHLEHHLDLEPSYGTASRRDSYTSQRQLHLKHRCREHVDQNRKQNPPCATMAAIHGDLKVELSSIASWAADIGGQFVDDFGDHRGFGNNRFWASEMRTPMSSSSEQLDLSSILRIPTSSCSSPVQSQLMPLKSLGSSTRGLADALIPSTSLQQQQHFEMQQQQFHFPGQFSSFDDAALQYFASPETSADYSLKNQWDTEGNGPREKRQRLSKCARASSHHPVGLSSIRDSLPARSRERRDRATSSGTSSEAQGLSHGGSAGCKASGKVVNLQTIDEILSCFSPGPVPEEPQLQSAVSRFEDPPSDTLGLAERSLPPLLDKSSQIRLVPEKDSLEQVLKAKVDLPLEGGWPSQGLGLKCFNSLGAANDTTTMEKLLVDIALALESKDVNLAYRIIWVLNNIVSAEGDPNQRVASSFLKALVRRAGKMAPKLNEIYGVVRESRAMSGVEYAVMVDITPWYRFGFKAANGVMMELFEGKDRVHIVDFTTTYGMQWPTLIEALSLRPEGPPRVRLTVHKARPRVAPFLDMSQEDVITRLVMFANTKNVDLEVNIIPHEIDVLDRSMFDIREDEITVANCMYRARFIPDETADPPACLRDGFLKLVHSLNPALVTLVDEEVMVTSPSLVTRLKAAFNYLWIPFDALDTFLPRDSPQRVEYELDLAKKVEDIIANEGLDRIERMEPKAKWAQRMKKAGFEAVPFSEDVADEVKTMLSDHAAGWGMKQEEDALLLTWKGNNVLFATVWQPSLSGLPMSSSLI